MSDGSQSRSRASGGKTRAPPVEPSSVVLPVAPEHVDSVRARDDESVGGASGRQDDSKRSRKTPRKETSAKHSPTDLEGPQQPLDSQLLQKLHEEQVRSAMLVAERTHIEEAARGAVQQAEQSAQTRAQQQVAEMRETAEQAVASTIMQVQMQAEVRQKHVEEELAAQAQAHAILQEQAAKLESGRANLAEQQLQREAEKQRVIEGGVLLLRQQLVERDKLIDKISQEHSRVAGEVSDKEHISQHVSRVEHDSAGQ